MKYQEVFKLFRIYCWKRQQFGTNTLQNSLVILNSGSRLNLDRIKPRTALYWSPGISPCDVTFGIVLTGMKWQIWLACICACWWLEPCFQACLIRKASAWQWWCSKEFKRKIPANVLGTVISKYFRLKIVITPLVFENLWKLEIFWRT